MSAQQSIMNALEDYAKAFPFSPDIPIVVGEETPFKPTVGREYLEVRHFVAPTNTLSVGAGRYQYTGILQVTVVFPKASGKSIAVGIADDVIDHFEKGTIIDGHGVRVKINRQPDQATPTPDGAWLRVPVSIPYQCMA